MTNRLFKLTWWTLWIISSVFQFGGGGGGRAGGQGNPFLKKVERGGCSEEEMDHVWGRRGGGAGGCPRGGGLDTLFGLDEAPTKFSSSNMGLLCTYIVLQLLVTSRIDFKEEGA